MFHSGLGFVALIVLVGNGNVLSEVLHNINKERQSLNACLIAFARNSITAYCQAAGSVNDRTRGISVIYHNDSGMC